MPDYVFKRGRVWEPAASDAPLSDRPADTEISDHLAAKGFERVSSLGPTWSQTIEVWGGSSPQPYVVTWALASTIHTIYAPEVPDLLELMSMLSAVTAAELLQRSLKT
ncbi:MAG TPA: hypothetical protein VGN17_20855 [Bryobacteraceae bacterium]|jgi:hypothetical protein